MKVEVDVIKPATPSAADQNRKKMIYFAVANLVAVIFCVLRMLAILVRISLPNAMAVPQFADWNSWQHFLSAAWMSSESLGVWLMRSIR